MSEQFSINQDADAYLHIVDKLRLVTGKDWSLSMILTAVPMMAAAPVMLRALEAAEEEIVDFYSAFANGDHLAEQPTIKTVRAAISQAKGGARSSFTDGLQVQRT